MSSNLKINLSAKYSILIATGHYFTNPLFHHYSVHFSENHFLEFEETSFCMKAFCAVCYGERSKLTEFSLNKPSE